MLRIALIAAVTLSFASLDAADAASKRKRQHVQAMPVHATPVAPATRTPGPIWAGPGECYTDEGYGRYTACGAGRGGE